MLKILEIISKHLEVLSQPTGTGKNKKKADPKVVSLAARVREIRNHLQGRSKEVAETMSGLQEADKGTKWDEIAQDLIEVSPSPSFSFSRKQHRIDEQDRDFVTDIGKKVVDARSGAIRNLQALLNGKKL